MPPRDLRERPFQSSDVQWPTQSHGGRIVVEGTVRFQLIQKPQALLRERERQCLRALTRHQRWCKESFTRTELCDVLGQGHHRRAFKQRRQRDLDLEYVSYARNQ